MEVGGHDVNGQVAEAKYMITEPDIIEANAEFICRACNSHDGLVAACKLAVPLLKQNIKDIGGCDHNAGLCVCGLKSDLETIKTAITAATGEK